MPTSITTMSILADDNSCLRMAQIRRTMILSCCFYALLVTTPYSYCIAYMRHHTFTRTTKSKIYQQQQHHDRNPCHSTQFLPGGNRTYRGYIHFNARNHPRFLKLSAHVNNQPGGLSSSIPNNNDNDNDPLSQYNLFKQYHAKGRWRGIWNTYDYMGDVLDTTQARYV